MKIKRQKLSPGVPAVAMADIETVILAPLA